MSLNLAFYNILPQIIGAIENVDEWRPIVPPKCLTPTTEEESNERNLSSPKRQSEFPSSLYDTLSKIKKPVFPQSSNLYMSILLVRELCSCDADESLITHEVIEEVFLENLRRDSVAPAEDDCKITWFLWGKVLDVRRRTIKFSRLAQRVREEFDDETATKALRLIAGRVLYLFNFMLKRRYYAKREPGNVQDGTINYQDMVIINHSIDKMTLNDLEDCIVHLGERVRSFEVDWLLEYGVVPKEKETQSKPQTFLGRLKLKFNTRNKR
ncbi:hypothetical protein F4821DRAFT_262384 [Hypoxylon rubiginosum]|uniref:Uncharacterized protein n=1 Tax=Hypoxylon rubiginosum TaxID=110542 RepID=A0ACC0CU51_9PEZI|nr:hypothetical protein F4821DRAFT_262384 [Hypoxylon rubiginosum]